MNLSKLVVIVFTSAAFSLSACASPNSYKTPDFGGASYKTANDFVANETAGQGKLAVIDISGEDRSVTTTDDWKVCVQSKGINKSVSNSSKIVLGVVKTEESCPQKGVVKDIKKVADKVITKKNEDKVKIKDKTSKIAKDNGQVDWTNPSYIGVNKTSRPIKEIQKRLEIPMTGVWDHTSSEETFKQKYSHGIKADGDWTNDIDKVLFK